MVALSAEPRAAQEHDGPAEVLLRNMLRIRTVVAPLAVVLVTLFAALDPVPWKLWWLGLTLGPLAAFFLFEGVLAFWRGHGVASMRTSVGLVLIAQASVVFITGGIESPLLKAYPAFALVLGVFLGQPRRFLPVVGVLSAIVTLFAFGPLAGLIPRSSPRFLFLGPGFWDRPVYVATLGGFAVAVMFASSLAGGWLRRTLDGLTQQAVDARRQALAAMDSRNREIVSSARTIAHELKNPLAAVRGLAQLISRDGEPGGKQHERLKVMLAEIDRMRHILDGFRDLGRPLGELEIEPVPLGAVVRDVAALSEGVAQARGARLLVRAAAPVVIQCDRQKLKQALLNLVQNGLEAVGAGGRVEVNIAPEPAGGARVTVVDSGPPVPEEIRRHLFSAGFTTKAGGSGLGLVVARAIAEQHGGDLSIEFAEAGGCRAALVLPPRPPPGEEAA